MMIPEDVESIADDVMIVGIQHNLSGCEAFYAGAVLASSLGTLYDHISIKLQREPDNPNDPYAIKVFAKWLDEDMNSLSSQIGYIPSKVAYMVGENTDVDDKLYGEFVSIERHPEYGFTVLINVQVKYRF